MNDEIKNCPFCGKQPIIESEIKLNRNNEISTPYHDFEVFWSIRCNECGTSKRAYGATYYKLKKDGNFEIVAQAFNENNEVNNDKRQEVIDKWNQRFD